MFFIQNSCQNRNKFLSFFWQDHICPR